jgi:hypothetical protein
VRQHREALARPHHRRAQAAGHVPDAGVQLTPGQPVLAAFDRGGPRRMAEVPLDQLGDECGFVEEGARAERHV